MSLTYLFFLLAAAVVVGLSAYAAYLWQQVVFQRRQQEQLLAQQREKRREWIESVKIIANVIVQEQANMTECAIRIKVLLSRFYNNDCPKPQFRAIYELAWATAHMPILEQRKKYSRQQLQAYDDEREGLEAEMGDAVKQAAQAVLDYSFESDF